MSDLMQKIRGAVARGWCRDGNTHKEMDATLAEGIAAEVTDLVGGMLAGISTASVGYWGEGDSIADEYDTVALRDTAKLYAKYEAARQPQERGEAVALTEGEMAEMWIRANLAHPDHATRKQVAYTRLVEQEVARRYAHPPADDARVAELEAQVKHFAGHIAYIGKQLTESREREARMREALEAMLEIHGVTQRYADTHIEIPQSWVEVSEMARAALAADKGEK